MSSSNLERGGTIEVSCLECGIKFKTSPSRIKYKRSLYCSRKCSSISKAKRYKGRKGISRYGSDNPNWKGIRIPKPCPVCGETFTSVQKTCSLKCGHKLQGMKIRKEGNGNWEGMECHLMRNYHELMKDKPKKCQVCECEKRILTHHLDGDRSNNISTNLIYLCQHCHTILHFLIKHPKRDSLQLEKFLPIASLCHI